MSTSSKYEKCAIVLYEAIMLSAILRRNPMTLCSSVPFSSTLVVEPTGDERVALEPPAICASKSAWDILPAGPEPATWSRLIFASRERCRTAGLASAFVPAALVTAGAAGTGSAASTGAGLAFDSAGAFGISSTYIPGEQASEYTDLEKLNGGCQVKNFFLKTTVLPPTDLQD